MNLIKIVNDTNNLEESIKKTNNEERSEKEVLLEEISELMKLPKAMNLHRYLYDDEITVFKVAKNFIDANDLSTARTVLQVIRKTLTSN